MQRGLTKEGDKARRERAGRARERETLRKWRVGNGGGGEDENSIGKIGKNERKVRMVSYDLEESRMRKMKEQRCGMN